MAADLFETYAVTIVATMVLSSIFFVGDLNMMVYPLTIGAACLITSIIGTFFVKLGKSKNEIVEILKGITVGELIVDDGVNLLVDYQKVKRIIE